MTPRWQEELHGPLPPSPSPDPDADARALASSLRLRILRLCLDEPRSNREIAAALGRNPGSTLHHVRTLVDRGFLAPLPARRGVRGSREVPYLATGRSWHAPDVSATAHTVAGDDDPRSERRPTLAEVARLAGVSLKTASRVLNGEKYVADATRARVLDVAESTGFRLNPMASLLKSGVVHGVVAFITGDVANPFYSTLAQGVEREVRARGLQLTIASSDESAEAELALIDVLALRRVRGIVLTSTLESHEALAIVQERGVPIVFVDRAPAGLAADSFVIDNYGGTRAAIEQLLAHGHRRIAYIGDYARLPPQRERIRAYGDVMEAAEVGYWRRLVREGAHDVDSAHRLARQLLEDEPRPTAIFASNNRITTGVLHALAEVAPSTAVIGFDDFDLADLLGVTTVSYDAAELGRQAARAVLDRESRRAAEPRHWVLPTRIVQRGSGERLPRA